MTDEWLNSAEQAVSEIRAAIDESQGDAEQTVRRLSEASVRLNEALNEAMAAAAISGASMRSIAAASGLAPNSIPPRLGRSSALAPYADPSGTVGAEGIAIARHHNRTQGTSPMAFKPRRKDSEQ